MNLLEIAIYQNDRIIFQKIIEEMRGNYIFGRSYEKCSKFAQLLSEPTKVINLASAPAFVSNLHAVICEVHQEFHLIDGWGKYQSRNGVYVNQEKCDFRILQPNDCIHLGRKEVEIIYRKLEFDEQERERQTENSEFF